MSTFADHEYRKNAETITLSADTFVDVLGGNTLPAVLLNKLRVRPPDIKIGLGRTALHFPETEVELMDELDRFVLHAFALSVNTPMNAQRLIRIAENSTLIDSRRIKGRLSQLKTNINQAAGAEVIHYLRNSSMPSRYIFRAVDFWQIEASSNEAFEKMAPAEQLAFVQQARHLLENGAPRKWPSIPGVVKKNQT